ncbi:DNA repair protein RecO [Hoeflea phototrophica DFL-43]|jgi:DNA repair protein RecO (recombination protein O)|uniref:DNA repair protein RecO n=1 Tax=Hoeflea phototrophica (strain DSM 17068 / NCIMB 14078 / DFL-43) TaxID=411684 RepID=A9DBE1_HOEPD|nr:DNA repair protein RecO [Hoeflea phototrophica]EDQ32498.1 DNA repair protein RecO [Hoeflea phototrophica DFL-43]
MEWRDEGIILGLRKHGETSVIAEVMTHAHGRHMGIVRGGRSKRLQPVLQPGNSVDLVWRARLDEHLGQYQVELINARAGRLMQSAIGVHGVQAMAALLRLLPERDSHPRLHDAFAVILDSFDAPEEAGALYVRFELAVLEDLGFGLDLTACAATGASEDLVYVSPKSGRAVSAAAGAPWAERMLALPAFLADRSQACGDAQMLAHGFKLSGYFLDRHVFEPRGIEAPISRESFCTAALKAMSQVTASDDETQETLP